MLAVDLIQYVTQALYLAVFGLALHRAILNPRKTTIQVALVFGAAAVSVGLTWIFGPLGLRPPLLAGIVGAICALTVPYLLLRLVDEFAGVPSLLQRLAEIGLALSVIVLAVGRPPRSLLALLALTGYFGLVTLYVTVAFIRESRRSVGVTARRMGAIAVGGACLTAAAAMSALRAAFPSLQIGFTALSGPFGLPSALGFYLGFTTPRWLLRSWQAPEFMEFVERADRVAEQSDPGGLMRELRLAVSRAMGLPDAMVGLWNEADRVLEYAALRLASGADLGDSALKVEGDLLRTPPDALVAGQCFTSQHSLYTENVEKLDPAHARMYRGLGVKAVIVAPLSVGDERYGVVGLYAARAQLFAENSLERLELLAHHAAIMLRDRKLLERAASVKAEAALAGLKEQFLAEATHDLKSPLTVIKGTAQLVRRRALSPQAFSVANIVGDLARIEDAVDRMRNLIDEVLDFSLLQMDRPLELSHSTVDLVTLGRAVAEQHQAGAPYHRLVVDADAEVIGEWDAARLERVLDNLLSNAVKFSPEGGETVITIRSEGEWARVAIKDDGVGISADDAEHIFDRFYRGSAAAERGIPGTGLGLSYARDVVAAHGGDISVESRAGEGSTFTVSLPLARMSRSARLSAVSSPKEPA